MEGTDERWAVSFFGYVLGFSPYERVDTGRESG
jgi:hypothetical protein